MTIHQDLTEAHALLTNIHGDIAKVLDRLHDQRGGYPTRTTGAAGGTNTTSFLDRPTPDEDPVHLTATEAAALAPDTATTELRLIATDAQAIVRAARRIARIYQPHLEPVPTAPTTNDIPDDWCRSCWRNDHHHTPVALRPNGVPYYAGLCRWCGAFKHEHKGTLPDLELIRIRHTRRITTNDIADWQKRRAAAKAKKAKKTKGA